MTMKKVTAWLKKAIADWMDPVCQDSSAVRYQEYHGALVRLRPVVEKDGHVKEWVCDPDDMARVDTTVVTSPPPLPGGASAPFNPAGVPGI